MRDPTPIEAAVLAMLAKPDPIPMPWADQAARSVVVIITLHMEQTA